MLAHEAVVVHREWVTLKKMRLDRLAWKVKDADIKRIFLEMDRSVSRFYE